MKINEWFSSVQGEGGFAGHPVFFIRTSGCTRNCDFCDTKYHIEGEDKTVEEIITAIKNSGMNKVVFTGGEPLLWEEEIYKVIEGMADEHLYHDYQEISFHLETNGDILPQSPHLFEYIAFSPKEKSTLRNVVAYGYASNWPEEQYDYDIKIVTDLETVGLDMIEDATLLMPLTVEDEQKNKQIQQKVWDYCTANKICYCQRIHIDVWGKKKGV